MIFENIFKNALKITITYINIRLIIILALIKLVLQLY